MNKKPLFMGKNEEDQCNNIFSKMGTPMPDEWPDIEELSEWHKFNIELASGIPLYELVKGLDDEGYQLLDVSFFWGKVFR